MLVYPNFLKIAITSYRMQVSDTELTDNHWYIHDLPRIPGRNTDSMSNFESGLLDHLQALGTPQRLIDSIKIHLITFVPGEHKGAKADRHGLLRLWSVIGDLGLDLVRITASRELCGSRSALPISGVMLKGLGSCSSEVYYTTCSLSQSRHAGALERADPRATLARRSDLVTWNQKCVKTTAYHLGRSNTEVGLRECCNIDFSDLTCHAVGHNGSSKTSSRR